MVVAGLKAGGSRCCTIGLSLVKRRCCLAGAASAVFSWNKRSDEVLMEAEDSAISGLLLEAHDAAFLSYRWCRGGAGSNAGAKRFAAHVLG